MKRLKLKRFLQEPSQCAIAACTSVANFYDPKIDYELVKITAEDIADGPVDSGLDTGEIGMLLNDLGFKNVKVVISKTEWFDYTWDKMKMTELIKNLKKVRRNLKCPNGLSVKSIIKFLSREGCNNRIVIDFRYGDYIRDAIDRGLPVILAYSWTTYFGFVKYNPSNGCPDPVNGDEEEHAVVICGYDKNGVDILDSHFQNYKYRLKKYQSGRYKMTWEDLMAVASEITIPEKFSPKLEKYELV